jgi:hypothetical protein
MPLYPQLALQQYTKQADHKLTETVVDMRTDLDKEALLL